MPTLYRSCIAILYSLLLLGLSACESTSNNSSTNNSSAQSSPSTMPADLSPGSNPDLPSSSTTSYPSDGGLSHEEIIAGLDAELDESIGVFDGMILDERARAEAIVANTYDPAGAGSEDSNEVLFEEGDLEEGLPGYGEFPESDNESGEEADASGDPSDGETIPDGDGTSAPSSASQGTAPGGTPEDIDDGSDDDIVARQIREAAQKEKDPALREKLWDEYRKYKDQTRN